MKIGILSCEHMHANGYVEALRNMPGVEIAGIAEKNEEAGRAFAERYGLDYFPDYAEFLRGDMDAVVITSANARHAGLCALAAEAGKHVLVEKPIATTLEDARSMIDVCKKNHVKLMVSFPVRYEPSVARAKEIIDSGSIGDIVAIAGTNHGKMPGGWFIDKALSGGGAVMDHTVHVADLMHWMLKSDIKDVYCKMGTKLYDIPVEDCGLLSMEFENGVYATLDASWDRPEAYPAWGDVTMEIIGTKGCINIDAWAQHGRLYSNGMKYSSHAGWGDDSNLLMLRDFIRCVGQDLPSPVPGEDGLFALKVALMAYRSAETGKKVTGL
jgi:predicted dehydrogenase